jgi:hypothetical protein
MCSQYFQLSTTLYSVGPSIMFVHVLPREGSENNGKHIHVYAYSFVHMYIKVFVTEIMENTFPSSTLEWHLII